MQELQSEVFHMSRFMVMGEMAENLAHELNQPLSAIVNYLKGSYRILERMEGPQVPMLREALKSAAEQALRAGNVIRHLREFVARGESERASEELQGLIEEATHLALLGAKDSGIEITFDFAHRTPFALVNRTQIQQVLLNLIRNALEAMDHAGKSKLVIKTKELLLESMVQVSVVDTGPGIAPAVLDKLFKPFTTIKKTRTAKLTGRPAVQERPGRRRDRVESGCAEFARGGLSPGADASFSSAPGSRRPGLAPWAPARGSR